MHRFGTGYSPVASRGPLTGDSKARPMRASKTTIGAAAMLSRAVGGIAQGRVVFSLPGSTKAVQLGVEKLILPQAGHLYFELQKHAGPQPGEPYRPRRRPSAGCIQPHRRQEWPQGVFQLAAFPS